MARMISKTPPDFHASAGEARVFQSLRSLPDNVVVIHSFRWLHPGNVRALTRHLRAQGEGDPISGLLTVWPATQTPHICRRMLADLLDRDLETIRCH